MPKFLTRAEAAQYLNDNGFPATRGTLEKWASSGGGPAYRTFGRRVLYAPDDLDAWAEAKLGAPRTSTSESAAS